jgi:hypothetical protein
LKEKKWKIESLGLKIEKERLIWVKNFAKTVQKSMMKKIIWIGVADNIRVNGEDKCGGVVVKKYLMLLGVSFQSTRKRKTMKKMKILLIKKKIS